MCLYMPVRVHIYFVSCVFLFLFSFPSLIVARLRVSVYYHWPTNKYIIIIIINSKLSICDAKRSFIGNNHKWIFIGSDHVSVTMTVHMIFRPGAWAWAMHENFLSIYFIVLARDRERERAMLLLLVSDDWRLAKSRTAATQRNAMHWSVYKFDVSINNNKITQYHSIHLSTLGREISLDGHMITSLLSLLLIYYVWFIFRTRAIREMEKETYIERLTAFKDRTKEERTNKNQKSCNHSYLRSPSLIQLTQNVNFHYDRLIPIFRRYFHYTKSEPNEEEEEDVN